GDCGKSRTPTSLPGCVKSTYSSKVNWNRNRIHRGREWRMPRAPPCTPHGGALQHCHAARAAHHELCNVAPPLVSGLARVLLTDTYIHPDRAAGETETFPELAFDETTIGRLQKTGGEHHESRRPNTGLRREHDSRLPATP